MILCTCKLLRVTAVILLTATPAGIYHSHMHTQLLQANTHAGMQAHIILLYASTHTNWNFKNDCTHVKI